jgi:hypothetical protein
LIQNSKPKATKAKKKTDEKKARAEKSAAMNLWKAKSLREAAEAREKKAANAVEREKNKESQVGGDWEESEEEEESDDEDIVNEKKEMPWNKWVTMDHAPDKEDGSKRFSASPCPGILQKKARRRRGARERI